MRIVDEELPFWLPNCCPWLMWDGHGAVGQTRGCPRPFDGFEPLCREVVWGVETEVLRCKGCFGCFRRIV